MIVYQVPHSLIAGIVAAIGAAYHAAEYHVSRIPPAPASDTIAVSNVANIRDS